MSANRTPLYLETLEAFAATSTSRHDRVLDAAAKQLNARGVSLTSLAEIAGDLGISRAAMYYYVEDREDLVFQCYRRACEITARHLAEAMREGGDAERILSNFIDRMLDPNEPELAARAETAMMKDEQRDTIQGLYDALATRIAGVLESGARAGLLRTCDSEVNARILLSMIAWVPLVQRWAAGVSTIDRSRAVAALKALLFGGLTSNRMVAPGYQTIDLSSLCIRTAAAFDREAMHEIRRETLVAVASRLFNRKGIDSTSLEEIAAQVGATKRTLHRHLGSKQSLVEACYERAFRVFLFVMNAMIEYRGTRLEALSAAIHALATAYPREDLTPLAPHVGFDALSESAQQRVLQESNALAGGYFTTLQQGVEDGSIAQADVDGIAMMLPGVLTWLVKDDVPTDPAKRDQIAREVATLVAVGLRK